MTGNYIKINANYRDKAGSLLPTVYSSKKFIEFIKTLLQNKEEGIDRNEYEFIAGNKINVGTERLSDTKTRVTVSYNEGNPPVGKVSNFTAEFGKKFKPGELSISAEVIRKSYPLKRIEWLQGVNPEIREDRISLNTLQLNQSYQATVTNSNTIGPEDTIVAEGGRYEDIHGQSGKFVSKITRQTRHFWGSLSNSEDSYDIHNPEWRSYLGSIPSEIEIPHGPEPTHFVIVTSENIEVFARGMKVGMKKLEEVNHRPLKGDLAYSRPYNVYISTSTSTGNYKYTIKRI